jgi:hypothetical protein
VLFTDQPSLEGIQRVRPHRPTWLVFRRTESLGGAGIPQSYHFPLIYVATCVSRGVARPQARPAMAWGVEANLFVTVATVVTI